MKGILLNLQILFAHKLHVTLFNVVLLVAFDYLILTGPMNLEASDSVLFLAALPAAIVTLVANGFNRLKN